MTAESHVKAVAPLEDTAEGVDSVAVVAETQVLEVRDLQGERLLPPDVIDKFEAVEKGEYQKLMDANLQGDADKYLHALAEEFTDKLAKDENILVKADVVVKNYLGITS